MTSCSRQNLIKSAFLSGFYCISMNGLSGGRAFVLLKLRRRCAQRGEWKISLQCSAAAAALGAHRHVSAFRCRRNKVDVVK